MIKGLEGAKLGRYDLITRIAQGGMSEVYLGYDRRVRRHVAVKVLYGSDEAFIRRFEREALAVGTLSHEHILPLFDFGVQPPWYYLVMPFVEGGTLRDYVYARGHLTLEEAGSFLEQIALALQHAHDHGVVHRDVKPSNILLRPDGHAYLVDFGLAKAKLATSALTYAGTMIGTPEYTAPEQSDGRNDHRSDIYSLGIILYQMLTGQVPFSAETPVGVTLKHLQLSPIPPSQMNKDIPSTIEAIILKALEKNPDERYQQAQDLAFAYRSAMLLQKVYEQIASSTSHIGGTVDIATVDTIRMTTTSPLTTNSTSTLSKETEKLQLIPLEYDELPIILPSQMRRRPLSPLFLVLCGLAIMVVVVTSTGFLFYHQAHVQNKTSSLLAQNRQASATMRANANAQATLAAQSIVQATVGITSAIADGRLLYYSDMTQAGGGWLNDGRQCTFTSQGYHVALGISHAAAWCYTNQLYVSDIVVSAQVQLLRGDIYGLMLRLNPKSKTFYVLEINSVGQFRFMRATGQNPANWFPLIDWTWTSAIHSGYNTTNTCTVVASGGQFRFYINQQFLVQHTDTVYHAGFIGLLVGSDSDGGAEALYSHIAVFQKEKTNETA